MRLTPEHRERLILDSIVKVAVRDGLYGMTRAAVAKDSGCSAPLVAHYVGSNIQIRKRAVKWALNAYVTHHHDEPAAVNILSQAIIMRDPLVDSIGAEMKKDILVSFNVDSEENTA